MIAHPQSGMESNQAPRRSSSQIVTQPNWPVVIAGGALALLGLRKITSGRGLLLASVGGALLYRGLGCACGSERACGGEQLGDSTEATDLRAEYDAIDEASWESFPASDSPSFSPGKA